MTLRQAQGCIVGPRGVTLRRGHHSAFFAHATIDSAPMNWDIIGGVIATDEMGREWMLDEAWMIDYLKARLAFDVAPAPETEYNSGVGA